MNPHAKKYECRSIAVEHKPSPAAAEVRLATILEEPPQSTLPGHTEAAAAGTGAGNLAGDHAATSFHPWASLGRPEGMTGTQTVALFMPILAFERYTDWEATFCIINKLGEKNKNKIPGRRQPEQWRRWDSSTRESRDMYREVSDLINGYLYPPKDLRPLHCRRTLDQYSYHMLDTTARRDKDQAIYRWAKRQEGSVGTTLEGGLDIEKSLPIIMVDQLWLWVLPDGTVITSFPNTQKSYDRYNIGRLLSEKIETNKARRLFQGPEDLVSMVLDTCLDIETREGPCNVKIQECFRSYINAIGEDQAVAMDEFLKSMKKLADAPDPFQLAEEIDSFSKVTRQTTQLIEIIDIRDELDIIRSVLSAQKRVLEQLWDIIRAQPRAPTARTADTSTDTTLGGTAFKTMVGVENAINTVGDNLLRVEEMDAMAIRVHVELKQLLEFKQQQANGWEARYARKLSEQGQEQNTITLVFTVVTIIFLPMSFTASFFALNVDRFPKNQESGEPDWPFSTIATYIFGISIAFSGLVLLLVGLWLAYRRRRNPRRRQRRTHRHAGPIHPPLDNKKQIHDNDFESHRGSEHSYWESDNTGDEETQYAHLFNRWTWHTHIPYVRRLWEWKLYKIRRQKHLMRRSQEGMEWDYPLSRWRYRIVWVFRGLGRSVRRRWWVWRRSLEDVEREDVEERVVNIDIGGTEGRAHRSLRGVFRRRRKMGDAEMGVSRGVETGG
ncbi:hypothetical protein QBC34DRAFT_164894 [Podospora aff. communis PSN243]|uniref:Uncharacterized protein n=1 Tax=Podospora aff. communis PSN243 TaxID=3040156 RepID=A0AAV9GB47_9PEZI|nr:hypothetical protein QBC34DRAFT_164894 [Podospora aff. communis PSN243]